MTHSNNTLCLGLQGHRGARGLFPENTVDGFRATLALGVAGVELDVTTTADGIVVVTHDLLLNPDIARDASGAWVRGPGPAIRDLTFAELCRIDVGRLRPGSAYAAQFPLQQPNDGARIPSLVEVLRIDPAARYLIELKTDPRHARCSTHPGELADATLAIADASGATPCIALESFDWRGPRHVRRHRPDVSLAWLTREETVRDAHLWWGGPHPTDFGGSVPRAVAAEGGSIWAPEYTDLTPDLVAEAHDLGLLILPWTVNDPAWMRRLTAWGADGLITDRPDLAVSIFPSSAGSWR